MIATSQDHRETPHIRRRSILATSVAALLALHLATGNARAQDLLYVTEQGGTLGTYNLTTGAALDANFVTTLRNPQTVTFAGDVLYVTDLQNNTIGTYNAITGAPINPSFISGLNNPWGVVRSGTDLFVTNSGYYSSTGFTVSEYDASTGAAIKSNFITGLSYPTAILISGNNLFVANSGSSHGGGTTVGLYNATTGAAINTSFISGLDGPLGLAISGNNLFVSNWNNGIIGEYNATTGATINASFITGLSGPEALLISGNNLLVSNQEGTTVGEYNATTGAAINASFISGLFTPDGLAFFSYTGINALGPNAIPDDTTADLVINSLGTSGPVPIAAATTNINTLTQNFTTASTIDTSPGTLRLGISGAIIITPGSADLTIGTAPNSGILTAGGNAANVAGSLFLENESASLLTINSTITDNGTGAVSITADGIGATVFTGTNTYTGATAVSNGILQLGTAGTVASISTASAVSISNGGTLSLVNVAGNVFTNNVTNGVGGVGTLEINSVNDMTVSGILSDGAAGQLGLTQSGAGTTILTATNPYTGPTMVNNGILEVNGSIASTTTTVGYFGTLQGSGRIGGNVINNGVVHPITTAGGPSTLTISGNYTQSSTGNLVVSIASSSNYSRLQINGTANLAGTLTAVPLHGYQPQPGDSFQIITATGGLNGTKFSIFNNQVPTLSLLTLGVTQTSNAATLTFGQGPIPTGPTTGNNTGNNGGTTQINTNTGLFFSSNELAIANEINKLLTDPRMAKIFAYLDRFPLGAIPGLLDRIAAEELSSSAQTTIALADVHAFNIQNRTDAIHSGASGFSAFGFHLAGSGPDYSGDFGIGGPSGPLGDDGKESKEIQAPAPPNPRLGTFITGEGEWVGVGNTADARGYDLATGGFTLGVDYKFTPNFALGIDAGYAHTAGDLENGGRSYIDSGKLGLYGTYFTGGFYVDTAVTGGYNGYDNRRAGLDGNATGSTHGGELDVLFGTGYDWHIGALSIGPTANFQYTYVATNSYTESGSLAPMAFPDQSVDSIRSAFGMKASYDWKIGGVTVKPEVRAAWQHEYGETAYGIVSRFANGAGNNFTVFGPEIGRDSLLVGAGFSLIWNDRCSSYIYYDGEVARTNYSSNTISGGIRISF